MGDPPPAGFYVDQTSMSSGAPTFEINVTDASGISHLDWLQDLVNTNHLVLRERNRPANSLVLEISSNTPGAGFQTIVGDIRSGNGTFEVGITYDIWEVTTSEDFITGPASSSNTRIPTFSDTTGKVLQDNSDLRYGFATELELGSATSAIEIQERAAAPAPAGAKGHVWVKDDAPNVLTFGDDLGNNYPLHGLDKNVGLGTWAFGASTLGTPASGVFDTDNATLTSITAVRFNGTPASGQAITAWADLLPQEGILYFQDTTNPGGTSVTFAYTSVTFPAGASYPQFKGPGSATVQGTNWSANDYSLQLVGMSPTLEEIINGDEVDNDVIVPGAIALDDNAVTLTPLTVISTTATSATPSVKITRLVSTDYALEVSDLLVGRRFGSNKIEHYPNSATAFQLYYLVPEDTTSGTYHGRDVEIAGGDHSGSQRGGNLTLNGGVAATGPEGDVTLGLTDGMEITFSTGLSIVEGADHPVTPVSGAAQLWLSTEYDETSQSSLKIHEGHVLKMTQYQDWDIEMSWLTANYKQTLGAMLAFGHTEEHGIVGGTSKAVGDNCVSFIYDHLSNMFYQAFIDNSLGDARVSSSTDGYTWSTFHTVDTAISGGDLAQPCTDGTKLGVAADGAFYLSTDLTSANLPAAGFPTGTTGLLTGSTGLVWHIGSQLWVMCGDNGTTGYILTSPAAGTSWTLRYTFPATVMPVTMDIAHPGYGGYNSTERILIFCGATGANMYWSDNGTSWIEDTGGNPTTGLMHVVWAPSIRTNNSKDSAVNSGTWVGMDASKNLWVSRTNGAGNWDDTNTSCDWLAKSDEFCWYGTAGTSATNMYTIASVADGGALTGGWVRGRHVGVLDDAGKPLFRCSDSDRARYTWGNGVIAFDREDGEFIIGRYGPIT